MKFMDLLVSKQQLIEPVVVHWFTICIGINIAIVISKNKRVHVQSPSVAHLNGVFVSNYSLERVWYTIVV